MNFNLSTFRLNGSLSLSASSMTLDQRLFPIRTTIDSSQTPPRSFAVVPLPPISLTAGPSRQSNHFEYESDCQGCRPLDFLGRQLDTSRALGWNEPRRQWQWRDQQATQRQHGRAQRSRAQCSRRFRTTDYFSRTYLWQQRPPAVGRRSRG